MRVRWLGWAPLAIGCVGKVSAGEACSFQDAETYDTVCRDGEMFQCEGGVWVDLGTEMGPDPEDTAVLAAPECQCTSPDESSCTFSDY